jgi:imidazole glycerol-phosphate synthase subunit HisF
MLRSRIIPCLLVKNQGLVKTVGFEAPKYVGDPINAVRIFNEKEVDELIVVDIDATAQGREPDYELIEQLAAECRMPLCYGGGVKTGRQIERIVALGVEKVALSSGALAHPQVITEAGASVGSQSVVVVLDVKRGTDGRHQVYTHNGSRATGRDPFELAVEMERLGAGEIVLNSIDRDGRMNGYDLELIEQVRKRVGVPLTVLGGAGSLKHMEEVIQRFGPIGVAAGSLFVFKGVYRAVLINYPDRAAKSATMRPR